MIKGYFGTCPKCGEMGGCNYKGKAHICKDGPGSDTYKVSLFKCKNCGKKFGFELVNGIIDPRNKNKEDDDWKKIKEILEEAYDYLNLSFTDPDISNAMYGIRRALEITAKHRGCNS